MERRLDSIVCLCVCVYVSKCSVFLVCLAGVAIHTLTAVRDIQVGLDEQVNIVVDLRCEFF